MANALPFAKLLGIEIAAASREKGTAEMVVRDDLCTCPAILHGGAIMSLADYPRSGRQGAETVRKARDEYDRKPRRTFSRLRPAGRRW